MSFRCEGCTQPHHGRPAERIVAKRQVIYDFGRRRSRGDEVVHVKKLCPGCDAKERGKEAVTLPEPKFLSLLPPARDDTRERFRPAMTGRISKIGTRAFKAAFARDAGRLSR